MRNSKTLSASVLIISAGFLLIAVFLFASCGAIIKSYINKDDKNVPADFGKDKSPVLVVKWKKKYNNKVAKYFKEYYKGEYLFISRKELQTTYTDTLKYRYIFGNDFFVTSRVAGMPGESSGSLSFRLTDRATNKTYETGVSSGTSWGTIAKTYIKKLEKAREKNANP